MEKVQLVPLWSVAGGVAGLVVLTAMGHLSPLGWIAGTAYLVVSNVLLARGLHASGLTRFGPANTATLLRSTLVGLVTALVATGLFAAGAGGAGPGETGFGGGLVGASTQEVPAALLVGLAAPALALDAVDGWIARRTGTTSDLGARFDMEVDAFLLLVLGLAVAPALGWWVVAIGALRYAFVAAGWIWPWMNQTLPPRYWRKVVTAVAGIALVVAATELLPLWVAQALVGVALALLLESFGRDVIWLVRAHRRAAARTPVWAAVRRSAGEPGA
jgi:phosphatidylglycerophosphate synthase